MERVKNLISELKFKDYDKKLLIFLITLAILFLDRSKNIFIYLSVIGFSYYLGFEYFIISLCAFLMEKSSTINLM